MALQHFCQELNNPTQATMCPIPSHSGKHNCYGNGYLSSDWQGLCSGGYRSLNPILTKTECKKVENKRFPIVPNQVLNALLTQSLAVYVQKKEKKEEEQEKVVEEEVEEKEKQNAVEEEELRRSLGLHLGGKK